MISREKSIIIRGVAIIIVLISHYSGWMYYGIVHENVRYFLSTLGPWGVDIFFLLSGYGLVKSLNKGFEGRASISFLVKRLITVYIPYIAIATAIMIFSGSFKKLEKNSIIKLITGFNYWYIFVMMILYFIFAFACFVATNDDFRLIIIFLSVTVFSIILYKFKMQDFWYISNLSFFVGCFAAFKEKLLCDETGKLRKRVIFCGLSAMGIASLLFLLLYFNAVSLNPLGGLSYKLLFNVVFPCAVILCMYLIPDIGKKEGLPVKAIMLLGSYSLYIYLMHTSVFWLIIENISSLNYILACIIIFITTVIISLAVGLIITRFICEPLIKRLNKDKF